MKPSVALPLVLALGLMLVGLPGLAGIGATNRSVETCRGTVADRVADERAVATMLYALKVRVQVQEWNDTLLLAADPAKLSKQMPAIEFAVHNNAL